MVLRLEDLPSPVLSSLVSTWLGLHDKLTLRLVCTGLCDLVDSASAWCNVDHLLIRWDGDGGWLKLNQFCLVRLDRHNLYEQMDWLLPKLTQTTHLLIVSDVLRKSETFYENFHPPEEFWLKLVEVISECRFGRLQNTSFEAIRLGLPSDLAVVDKVLTKFSASLRQLKFCVFWRQMSQESDVARFADIISKISKLECLKLSFTEDAASQGRVNMVYFMQQLQKAVANKRWLSKFSLECDQSPDLASLLQLVNSFQPATLRHLRLELPHGDPDIDFSLFWQQIDPAVTRQLHNLDFNLRMPGEQSTDWLMRIPSLCPELRFLRTDYVHKTPLTSEQLTDVATEWFWGIGENKVSVYWWPLRRHVHLRNTMYGLDHLFTVVAREEIGSNLCWLILSDDTKRLEICLKRC